MPKSKKLIFIHKFSKNQIENYEYQLLDNFDEIKQLFNQEIPDIMKILYFNKKKVHEILYNEEQTITISSHNIKKNILGNLFYLDLLISENTDIINYKYTYDFLGVINEYNKMNKEIQKIIVSMIIIRLIDNYRGFNEEIEEKITKGKIDSIENLNINMIEENIFKLKKYNLKIIVHDYKNNKIDEIYAQIIKQIITNYNYENIENTYDILNQLEMEKIAINYYIFNKLISTLDIKNRFINEIKIINKNDFLRIEKINFYYILFKYILKNPIYIYQIPFLVETRKIIINIIKNDNLKSLNKDKNFNICKNMLIYVIKTLTDSEYFIKIFELNLSGLKVNFEKKKVYKETKENNNEKKIEYEENNNENKRTYEEYNTNEYNNLSTMHSSYNKFNSQSLKNDINNFISKKNNKKKFTIIYDLKQCDKNKNIDLINSKINKDENIENPEYINSRKILNFLEEFDEIIKRETKYKLNSQILLTLIEEDNRNKNNIYNFTCEYKYEKLKTKYRDENILINGLNQGFQAFICDIKYE